MRGEVGDRGVPHFPGRLPLSRPGSSSSRERREGLVEEQADSFSEDAVGSGDYLLGLLSHKPRADRCLSVPRAPEASS